MEYIKSQNPDAEEKVNSSSPGETEETESVEEILPFRDRFDGLSDEDIVQLCHNGDTAAEEYLLNKYKNFVRSKARSYFLIGADHEDIVQEGMIGLFKAIRDYKTDKGAVFSTFATLCIRRQLKTALSTQNRLKHQALNEYISLYADDKNGSTLADDLPSGCCMRVQS